MPAPKNQSGVVGLVILLLIFIPLLIGATHSAICSQTQGKFWCAFDPAFYSQLINPEAVSNISTPVKPSEEDPETKGWKTFTNSNYGYSIKYPETHIVSSECDKSVELTGCYKIFISTDTNPRVAQAPRLVIYSIDKSSTAISLFDLHEIVSRNFTANRWTSGIRMKNTIEADKTTFLNEEAYTYNMDTKKYSGHWESFALYDSTNHIYEFIHNGIYFIIAYPDDLAIEKILKTLKLN